MSGAVKGAPQFVKEYSARVREIQRVKDSANTDGSFMGCTWRKLDEDLRVFMLSCVAGDDWERWHGLRFESYPLNLQLEIRAKLVRFAHQVQGFQWH